jgi:hypothetical protein
MNQAIEMLRRKAQEVYELVAGESSIELLIDPIEEPTQVETVQPTHTVRINTDFCKAVSKSLTDSNNYTLDPCIAHLNWLFEQQGKVKVWIYNVSHREYTLGNGVIRKLVVPACREDEEYSVVTSLPAVMFYPRENVDSDETEYTPIDGRRVAMDLINPSNLSIDQDADFSWNAKFSLGSNFSVKGIFFSTHNPPLKREIKAAHRRLKSYYKELVGRAELLNKVNFIGYAAKELGVAAEEIQQAQQYVQDSIGNK